jgi:response regulator RpfG family c-di-GMP phosphodiesterase
MAIKVLIVDADHNMHHFYQMVFDDFNKSIEIIEANSGEEAIELFQNDDNFSPNFIISDYQKDDQDSVKFYQFLRHRYSDIPFVVVTAELKNPFTDDPEFKRKNTNHIIIKPAVIKELRSILADYFSGKKEQDPEDISGEFQKINTYFFLRFQKTLCDVYIKLSNQKFIKILHEESGFEATDIHRYLNKGMEYLYITNEDFESFKVSITNLTFLETIETEGKEDYPFDVTMAVIGGLLQSYGLNETLVKKGINQITDTQKDISNSKELFKIFDMKTTDSSFYSDHSLLISLLSGMTLEKLDWRSTENFNKLCLASILHDCLVPDHVINTIEGGNIDQISIITDIEKDQYQSHPQKTAELIRTKTSFHEEVATIIAEHHEKPDGSGFPRKLTHNNIHPFSCLFIIIHDFVEQVYITRFDRDLQESILENMSPKYQDGHFLTAFQAFKQLINEEESELPISRSV